MPETGRLSSLLWASSATKRRAIGLTAGPEKPLIEPRPWMVGLGANVSRSTSVMPRSVLIAEMASRAAVLGGQRRRQDVGDVGRHLGHDGDLDASLDDARVAFEHVVLLADLVAGALDRHLRAGEVELEQVGAGGGGALGELAPAGVGIAHDADHDAAVGEMPLEPGDVLEVLLERALADHLDVLEADEAAVAVVQGVEARRRIDDLVGLFESDGLVERRRPSRPRKRGRPSRRCC